MATPFRLATVEQRGARRPALLVDDTWVDLAAAARARGGPAAEGRLDLRGILDAWDTWLPWLRTLADDVSGRAPADAERLQADPATLRVPFLPRQIYAAGANYYDHAAEMSGGKRPDKSKQRPYHFFKNISCVIGPNETIRIPPEVKQTDWEAELAAVIGRTARRVGADRALECVAAYSIMQDVSARDQGRRDDQPWSNDWMLAKGWETYAPFGPWLVPAEFVGDPQQLAIKLWVNDELKQNTNTTDMIFTTAEQIEWLSHMARLEPGDVISTGTGAGVGRPKGTFLKPGDRVSIEIEKIGRLENPVAAE